MSTKRIEWIKHNGKEVLVADYSGLHSSELMDVFETGKVEVLKKDSSVLMMGIFNGTKIDNNYIATAKKEGVRLDKMIKRTAVVGMSGIQNIF